MSNKQTQEYVSPTLEAVTAEIQQRTKEGYVISHGPEYSAGEYVVKFERNAPDEVEAFVEVVVAPQPAAVKPQRGPKPKKAVAESAKESTEA